MPQQRTSMKVGGRLLKAEGATEERADRLDSVVTKMAPTTVSAQVTFTGASNSLLYTVRIGK